MSRLVRLMLLVGLFSVSLTACGDGETASDPLPVSRLPDPCRLITTTQLKQDLDADFAVRPVTDERPDRESTEVGCSWIRIDVEQSEEYLESDSAGFIDIVVRRSDSATGFDSAEFLDEVASDEAAIERPELVATEANQSLGDEAVSVAATLFVRKGDVLLTVSTGSPEALEELIPGIVERVIRRI